MTSEILIDIKLGQIKGLQSANVLNRADLFSFLGIPYAAPPTGKLRFTPPQPHPGWEGVLDATKEGSICAQMDAMLGLGLTGGDDCLYLNVYTPTIQSGANKPVMVYLHGGGFTFGGSFNMFYGPDFLVAKNVILVTLNYRLNIFGFLNMGLEDCPGNAGLRDSIAALQWIKTNISCFGGDPNNVTLFGESAGSASVHYLMMAPPARGLFHRCILQSGTAADPWAFQSTQESKDSALAIAKHLGCQSEDPGSVLEFLCSVPALDLVKPQNKILITPQKFRRGLVFPFVPSVETVGKIEERVVWDHPAVMMKQNPPCVPFLCGINSQEGLLLMKHVGTNVQKLFDWLENDFERAVPLNFNAEGAKEKLLGSEIKRHFFGDSPVCMEKINNYFDLYSDLLFNLSHYSTMTMVSELSPGLAYAYLFSFEGDLNAFKRVIMAELDYKIPGACHGDELGYLFYMSVIGTIPQSGSPEENVCNNMCSLWTDFAKTGVPHIEKLSSWTPCSQQNISHLNIGETLSIQPGLPFPQRYYFWKHLYASYHTNFLKGNL